MIDCLLVVVSYRNVPGLAQLLESVPAAVEDLTWHAVVVNNEPGDDLTAVTRDPRVQLVESGDNLGYAGGLNRGLAAAPPSRWTAFLNPDVRLGPGSVAALARAAGRSDAAVPIIRDDDGVRQCSLRREPTILRVVGDGLLGNHWPARPTWLSETVRDQEAYSRAGAVDWATGAVLVVATVVVGRAGPWDAGRFFLYSEETDYCRRLRSLGTTIHVVPDAVVHHTGAGSGTSSDLHALQEVNRVRYFGKWHGRLATAGFAGVVALSNTVRAHRREARAALGAFVSPRRRAALPGGGR
ncbi:glycosyltransferase family 2 protein [Janibacter sp. YB324]|uniref:glycosyltransferase family 2 protein n=1 Tax=Janibacter sp. YB324 TaxID=2761047 RepID=UPI0016277BF6|nr:glycosyltransferase family 2 protein [Janibacter sp. YB324]QNF93470.1 glycosyltransferase family 2 protein [Janibacter sp. YB324]